jgi:hypothetical protein
MEVEPEWGGDGDAGQRLSPEIMETRIGANQRSAKIRPHQDKESVSVMRRVSPSKIYASRSSLLGPAY